MGVDALLSHLYRYFIHVYFANSRRLSKQESRLMPHHFFVFQSLQGVFQEHQ